MGVKAAIRAAGVSLEVGAGVGSVGAAVGSAAEGVGAMYTGEVDEDSRATPNLRCDAAACSLQAENRTEHLPMAPDSVVVVIDDAARAGVDGGAAAISTAVGVEDTGEVGEDEGTDDRVTDAKILMVLHIPTFASSIICSRGSSFTSSMAMVATKGVDIDWVISRHRVDPHNNLDEYNDQPITTTT